MKRLRSSIAKQKLADILFFINPTTDINIFSNRVRKLYGKPNIFRVDGIYFDKREEVFVREKKNKPIFEGIDSSAAIVFQSLFSYRLLSNFYKKIDGHYVIINNGVDVEVFSEYGSNKRRELGIKDDELVFLTSAKWRYHKRLNDIINIFIEFEKNSRRVCHLIILGKDIFIGLIKHPRIHNIGVVTPMDLPFWYRTGDIFLFLSWLDNCPNSVIEAIACGLPVICTNQGGTHELIEMTKGGLVCEVDPEFNFKPVDLNNPPKPDYDKILHAIDKILANYDKYRQNIDRTIINIDNVAERYVRFIEEEYRSYRHSRCAN